MYLSEVRDAQQRGVALGIPSVCSAHPEVLRETLRLSSTSGIPALIECTCNQVNQFGGYTGMTPADFAGLLRRLADEHGLPQDSLILGGDHLGPSVWQAEVAEAAMHKANDLVRACVQAGLVKLHLDCSMPLKDDGPGGPGNAKIAERAAQLAQVAEECGHGDLQYVIGTEVPLPGGATGDTEELHVSAVEDVRQAIDMHREAFGRLGLQSAWDRVVAVVVQPGVEFGDDFVHEYQPADAQDLSQFIETQSLVYEAHSTDYQNPQSLREMVRDHFAILKVGPALTFAYREAIFALAKMEDELFTSGERSNLIGVLDGAMLRYPGYWEKYYRGSEAERALKRKYSLSDRARYYWSEPEVREALRRLRSNLQSKRVPRTLMRQFAPLETEALIARGVPFSIETVVSESISMRLQGYFAACRPGT